MFFSVFSICGNLAKGAEILLPQFNFPLSDQKVDADFLRLLKSPLSDVN